ncbi:DUF4840 domain-containing protein [Chryseobacterium indologenes]|uniref:DUF4840 domain-containing protein n=1 Tax=Chryseobacterium indologenes TaxID=253 RepID=UPI0021A31CD3|nr:DUF4840 domain-containing protein [Elizabethkingia anophelis]
MKKFINLKALSLLVILFAIPFVVTSCRNDDNDNKPNPGVLKVEDVNGNYTGKAGVSKGTVNAETNVSFTAQKNVISFSEFPIKEIIYSVINDATKADQAIAKLGKVKYDLNYVAALSKDKKAVELTFSPKELIIQVPVDGVNKKVAVTFVSLKKGIFTKAKTQNLNFELEANKITVEGTAINPFEDIRYNLPMQKK